MRLLPPSPQPDVRAATLVELLRGRGLLARLSTSTCCGEDDRRISVRRSRLGPAVELLCHGPDEPEPARWYAVRCSGRDRVVWEGPSSDDELAAVVRFVEELLTADPAELRARYRPLG